MLKRSVAGIVLASGLSLAAPRRGAAFAQEGLKVFAGIENVTDVDYRVHGSGQNEPGTNVILGVDWTF